MIWPFGNRKKTSSITMDAPAPRRAFVVRGFDAANVDRLLSGWRWDVGFTTAEIAAMLPIIRSRSRDLAKNSPQMKRWLQLIAINVVGEGFALKSTPHDGLPGATNYRLDETAARFIQWHWWRWNTYRDPVTRLTWCDSSGRKTGAEIDRLNAKTWARDGEYFIYVDTHAQNPYGISLRILRPDWCDHTYNVEKLPNGNMVHCGIELDPINRYPVAYYFHAPPRNAYVNNATGNPLTRIPAYNIIHGFTQDDENQPRGIPWGHAAMAKLKMLDLYDTAELTAARDEACSVRTYYAPKGDEDKISDLTAPENSDVADSLTAEKEPGQSEVLPIGWKQEVNTPQHPNRELTAFKASMLKDVASGFGVEYSNFANDWAGVSFSSVRVGTISERDMWVTLQNDMISQCKSPIFLTWLRSFLSLSVSGGLPVSKFDKFSEHEMRGRRWMWVDPMKDMSAALIAVDRKWKTNTQVASDMGQDYSDNIEESKRETLMLVGDNKESVPQLTGAQMTAALVVVQSYALGEIAAAAAVALLTAAGVPQDAAENMINNQPVKEINKDENKNPPEEK